MQRVMTLRKLIDELTKAMAVADAAEIEYEEIEVALVINNTYKTFERISFDVFADDPQIEILYR